MGCRNGVCTPDYRSYDMAKNKSKPGFFSSEAAFGSPGKYENIPTLTPGQQAFARGLREQALPVLNSLQNYLTTQGQTAGQLPNTGQSVLNGLSDPQLSQTQLYGNLNSPYNKSVVSDMDFQKSILDPALRTFKQDVAPTIASRFISMGSSNPLGNTQFKNSLLRGWEPIQEALSKQMADYELNRGKLGLEEMRQQGAYDLAKAGFGLNELEYLNNLSKNRAKLGLQERALNLGEREFGQRTGQDYASNLYNLLNLLSGAGLTSTFQTSYRPPTSGWLTGGPQGGGLLGGIGSIIGSGLKAIGLGF